MAKETSDLKVFKLTHREMGIVLALCSGESTRAIARKLSMSPGRLKPCLTVVFNKLGAQDRLELLLIATNNGISRSGLSLIGRCYQDNLDSHRGAGDRFS